MMPSPVVILVGHGAPPLGFPREQVARLKALEGRRRAAGGPMSAEEQALDHAVRTFPRTPENDPYREGIEALAAALRARLGGATLHVAYNEFCAPSLEQAAERAIAEGARAVTVLPSMLTPGGVHAEVEIPETIAALRGLHPTVTFTYAWPFDIGAVAQLLADRVAQTHLDLR